MKNLVLCLDGTANEYSADRTNVVKLFSVLDIGDRQCGYYHPGVGTMEPPGALTWGTRKATRLLGYAFGYGLRSDIRDAYTFLMNHYEEGDRIFIFGFSRGAYTARAVAALIHMYGLIGPGNEALVPYAIRMLTAIGRRRDGAGPAFDLARGFKTTFSSRDCKIHFVGLWDTVSSVGWIENQIHFPYAANNPDIAVGRHAIAIDERRAFFRSNLWRAQPGGGPADLRQIWFPGVHCDVGGGFPVAESALSDNALHWMIDEAVAHGLIVDADKRQRLIDEAARHAPRQLIVHNLLKWYWRPAEIVRKRHYNWQTRRWERRMNLARRRTIPPGSLVHETARALGSAYLRNIPPTVTFVPR